MTSIEQGPHYELASADLADWLDRQGDETWWSVDGDPLLTGRIYVPCPANKLAAELRRIDRPLLVQARRDDRVAKGQRLTSGEIDRLVDRFQSNLLMPRGGPTPGWANDRLFYLCWKGQPREWLIIEDRAAARILAADSVAGAK